MRHFQLFLPVILTLGGMLSSCQKRPDIVGVWIGSPVSVTNIDPAIDANATYTLEFSAGESKDSGSLTISALINANQAVASTQPDIIAPYETSVAATATVNGRWAFAKDDDDDVIVTLDSQTLAVNVDPEGVTFAQNIVSDEQQPVTDSLTTATVAAWERAITKAMRDNVLKVNEISDVEIHKGAIMSCEINGRDYSFRQNQ